MQSNQALICRSSGIQVSSRSKAKPFADTCGVRGDEAYLVGVFVAGVVARVDGEVDIGLQQGRNGHAGGQGNSG